MKTARPLPRAPRGTRLVRTRWGARLVQGDAVLSEIRDRPGPSHGVFDVLAAAVATFAPGAETLILGFAAGGLIAPLVALERMPAVLGIDSDAAGARIFRALCGTWASTVATERSDAAAWLRANERRFGAIVEDLSVERDGEVVKPLVSSAELPALMRKRLRPGGIIVANLFADSQQSLRSLLRAYPYRSLVVSMRDYHNRVVVIGDRLPHARVASRQIRATLVELRSLAAGQISVQTHR